ALNSIVFLLIGLDSSLTSLTGYWREILAAVAAVILARVIVVYGVSGLLRRTRERVPPGWPAVLAWGGVRGALSIVLALSLPRDLPHRDQLVVMTVGVVLASILVQGLTMAPLLRWLGLATSAGSRDHDRARAELRVSSLALREIEAMREGHTISPDDARRLSEPYHRRATQAQTRLEALQSADPRVRTGRLLQAVRHLLAFERDAASEDLRQDVIVPDTHDELAADVAARLLRLEAGNFTDPAELLGDGLSPKGGTTSPGA
ncbi:MAG: cation:proton antiporter, partial [Gemmatimonadales bacterium]